jgi:hypothetical protein
MLGYGKTALGSLSRQVAGAPPVAVLAGLLLAIALGIWWLARRRRALERVNRFFALTGLLMVAWLGFRVGADLVRARATISRSILVQDLAQPVDFNRSVSAAQGGSRRDVYLIVLDEYANAGVLRDLFQYDNRVFEDSLRQLGFTIPRSVRSNYVHTLLSLPSLLNFSHLTRVTAEVGSRSTDATLPNYLLENNRTTTFLKQIGYRFLFFPSQWWPSTSRNHNADWNFEAWSGIKPERDATRSDLRRSLLATTALAFLKRDDRWDADYIRRTLTALEQVAERPEPTFSFAHIVSPHWPYVFTADCQVAKPSPLNGRAGRKRAYTEQLRCLNQLLLHTVTTIIQRSATQPVILLQGDHGTNLLRYSDAESAAQVTPAQAQERFGAFGAYYVPDGGSALFADRVTIVNVLQKVLSHYYGAALTQSPDDLYMSLERTPYDFVKVNPSSLRPVASGATRARG